MIEGVNRAAAGLVGGLTRLMSGLPPWGVLLVHSLLIALVALAVYGLVSNQAAIKCARNRMLARVLEIRLFQDDPIAVMGAFGRVLAGTGFYMVHSLKPLVVLMPVVVLWIIQLAGWFEWRPLRPGEAALLAMKVKPGVDFAGEPASLDAPEGFGVETPAFRSLADQEVIWRIRALESAAGLLRCTAAGVTVEKEIVSSRSLDRVSPKRVAGGVWEHLSWPFEKPLPTDLPISEIRIAYPQRVLTLLGHDVNWLIALFVASMVFGFALKKPFGVEF